MSERGTILLVEDDADVAESIRNVLVEEGYIVEAVARGDDGVERASARAFDSILTDLRLPGRDGLEVVRAVRSAKPRLPIIVMTAHGTTETAINAMKLGAFEYLLKPVDIPELLSVLDKAVRASRQMTVRVELREGVSGRDALVGQSRAMQLIYKEIGRVAPANVPVLIRGETGTGKELIARAIYQHSPRAEKPFITINCAAVPEALLESELFGHERGAFTGAETQRIGRFEQASGGTIFLDEIAELSVNTQAKLLRVLQEQKIQRLGGKATLPIDVRILAATHQNLENGITAGSFREDLFYRLNVVTIRLPPLRERAEDIPALVQYFFNKYSAELGMSAPAISPDALARLQQQAWPGNIRELENVVRRLMLASREFAINVELMAEVLSEERALSSSPKRPLQEWIAELLRDAKEGKVQNISEIVQAVSERELFAQAIQLANGNQSLAARWLGVSRLTMREKLQHYDLRGSGDPHGSRGSTSE
jgi:nitrogen regulation protein NR(I)